VPSRIAGLFVAALVAVSCTASSSSEPSRSAHPSTPTSDPTPIGSSASATRTTSVDAFRLVSRSLGVAIVRRCLAADSSRCRQRLIATEDFGRTWTDITPTKRVAGSAPPELALLHPFFLDAEHAWVTANDCERGKAVLFITASGGRRWARTPIPASTCNAGAGTTPTFVDERHGWLVHLEPTGASATIQHTVDGGKTWSREQTFSWITGVRFADPRHGWLAGSNLRGTPGLFRTSNGGRTWTRISAPLPSCCRDWTALFEAPAFLDDEHAVTPVTLRNGNRSTVAFDISADGGRTWRVAARLPPVRGGSNGFPSTVPVSIASQGDWWVLLGRRPILRKTGDGGRTWRSIAPPTDGRIIGLSAVDARRAWVAVLEGRVATLLATRDGGRTWRALTPVARAGRPPTSAALRTVLPLPGPVTAVTPGQDGVVYASYLPHPNGDRQVIVRFDPATSGVRRSLPIAGGQGGVDRLAEAGGSLWASTGSPATHGGRILYRLDANTLNIRERIALDGSTGALAAVPDGLWAVAGRRIVLLDPQSGEAIMSVKFRGRPQLLVADPRGRRLYVSTTAPVRNDATPIIELDAATGQGLARARQCCADLNGPSGLSAASDGVWVTAPTGMMATLRFLRESDLRQTGLFAPGGSNGLTAYVARDRLWVGDLLGGYDCADATTGDVLGYVGMKDSPSGISNIVSARSGLYVGAIDGLSVMRPSSNCLGR
jgi:photosystem II stability/assembly factor-like uncharacterized protein